MIRLTTDSSTAPTANSVERQRSKPRISVIVVAHNMRRELPRTLRSLSPGYQLDVAAGDYEVIVADNGSSPPVDAGWVRSLGPSFQCLRIAMASASPARAVNDAVAISRGEILGVLVDGARLVTPGLLKLANLSFSLYEDPTVVTLAWHLGPAPQQESVVDGYDRDAEDRLLAKIKWPSEGYRLFEIASLAPSSEGGYFLPISESNAMFLRRSAFDSLGGFDEGFDQPGGGLVNLDFYKRACERPGSSVVMLLGEGSFHQFHGGVSTGVPLAENRQLFAEWQAEYQRLRGEPWDPPKKAATYLGCTTTASLRDIELSASRAIEIQHQPVSSVTPGRDPDR